MPLISSPIDGAPMRQVIRYGVEFDVCASTGGIWLDKGELEKLIALVREEVQAEQARAPAYGQERPRTQYRDRDDDDDDHHWRHGKRRNRLADLFDF